MASVDGGELVARALRNEGVEQAFVLCGGHIMPILYGLRHAGINMIDVRHECCAIYAAIGYAMASGKPAVVVTTAGPGVANTPAGMLEAASMGIPLLQIGGAVASELRHAGDLQDMDTLSLMEACTRWARKVVHARRIPEYLAAAFRQAMSPSPGPVYLEIPTDLLHGQIEESIVQYPAKYRANAIPWGDRSLVAKAAELLIHAERPAILVDDGARFSLGEHTPSIMALAEHLKMPVVVSGWLCRGLVYDEYRYPFSNPVYGIRAMSEADVVLAMGCRFDFRLGFGNRIKREAKVIQVHTDADQIGFNLRSDIGIIGGIGPVATQLLEAVKASMPHPRDRWWLDLPAKGGTALLWEDFRSDDIPIHPGRLAGEVAKFLEEEARDWNIVIDGGEAGVWMRIAASASRPGQLFGSGANGTLGVGPGLVLGAWAANHKPVLWYTGDGSFGFYAMEMDTMARFGIPVVCVISNDSGWGMVRLAEKFVRPAEVEKYGHCHTELHHMRAYERMALVWDGHGEMVNHPDQIRPAIRRAIASGKPSIINVEVDRVSMSPYTAQYAALLQASQ